MEILFYILLAIFITFTGVIIYLFGILPSFSHSYYKLGKYGFVFQLVLGGVAAGMAPVFFTLTQGEWYQPVVFFLIPPLLFVAAAPKFEAPPGEYSLEKGVHGYSAGVAAIASLVLVIGFATTTTPEAFWTLPISAGLALLGYFLNEKQNPIWWAEYACFGWMFSSASLKF